MTLYFKYSRPNLMDDQESHLTITTSTAWNSSPAMMHCIALHPCLLHSTTTSTHEIHQQFGQHQANSVEQTHIACGKIPSSWPPHCLPSSLSSRGTCATGEASEFNSWQLEFQLIWQSPLVNCLRNGEIP